MARKGYSDRGGRSRAGLGKRPRPDAKMPAVLANHGHPNRYLDSLNVLSLPALGALGDVELHGLAFLQAAEAARLNRGEMHEDVFAILAADEAVALGVVKPLYCSCFCHLLCTFFLFGLC
jgi:hypothetical protein